MVTIRKVTLALLLSAALAVLILAVFLAWNYRQWQYLPVHGPYASELDERAHILQDRVEILTKRVGDMELLVLVLLGTSGLYAIVFVVSSYFSAVSFARQADRSIANIKDELGLAMGDLRELKEEVERRLGEPSAPAPANFESQVAAIDQWISNWRPELDGPAKLELLHYENAAAFMELVGGPQAAPSVASLYRSFARCYRTTDTTRARFYLYRGLVLAPPDTPLASEIQYDLACSLAASGDFEQAGAELASAFKNRTRSLDARLARDLEEGGDLYEMANTPPFDRALDDLLLKMSVGAG